MYVESNIISIDLPANKYVRYNNINKYITEKIT